MDSPYITSVLQNNNKNTSWAKRFSPRRLQTNSTTNGGGPKKRRCINPHANLRAQIVPSEPLNAHQACDHHAQSPPASPVRMSWACLLKRVFDIDVEYCANCGGRLKIIAAIVDPAVITKILTHLHLPARAPPRSPARRVDLFQAT